MNRIAIVENQAIVREGLRMLLSRNPEFSVYHATDPIALFRQTWTAPPELVIMDKIMFGMNAIEAIEEVKKRWSNTKVLIFTAKSAEENIVRAFQAGASGYILKSAAPEELLFAIPHLLAGHYYVSPAILSTVIQGYCRLGKAVLENICGVKLSTRERELLKLIAEGNKNKDIANILCLSIKTVETHRYNLMKKLDIHNVAELTVFANRAGVTMDSVNNGIERQPAEIIINHPSGMRIVERRKTSRKQTQHINH
ncbi:oxygen regulatory protein NreC [Methyloglobulus morosus KoM1]|uniref:Oxygen regulatory protein NreC n=1 Tax=Methyloglobulus morosus KoM1 TaxID=1116472 RepID=V5C1B3_9GAMM|nr:response regulator transcription factor [Methyloglobulus morosus]ESS73889.1 oxygen regulatory protein NreC [Methyloglobulus morosus KoM1]